MEPEDAPEELQGLTPIEEMSLALTNPITRVYSLRGWQKEYECHISDATQGSETSTTSIPRLGADIAVIVMLRTRGKEGKHKDLIVRRAKLEAAARWLTSNNPLYHGIHIDEDILSRLPVEGQMPGLRQEGEWVDEEPVELEHEPDTESEEDEAAVDVGEEPEHCPMAYATPRMLEVQAIEGLMQLRECCL